MSLLVELKDDRSEKIYYDRPGYPIYIQRSLLSAIQIMRRPTIGTTI
jgi:hypothetical protein